MKKLKNVFLSLFIFSILILPKTTFASNDIKLWINGDYAVTDTSPIIENNRTLVPLRVISENLGYKVEWNEATREVTVSNNDEISQTIKLQIDNNIVSISNNSKKDEDNYIKKISLGVTPRIINNRTFVPIRAIAEIFDNNVNWDNANRTVIIGEGYIPMEPEIVPQNKKAIQNNQSEKIITTKNTTSTYVPDTSSGKIKGNKNSNIYHVPGGASYNKVSQKNVVYFNTAEEAESAGYRRAKR